jgi:hypothetical protein
VTSVSHLKQDSRRVEILNAYQPVLQLAGKGILAAGTGMEQGILRQAEAASAAGLPTTSHLVSISTLDDQEPRWLAPSQVSDSVLSALRQEMPAKKTGRQ